MNNIELRDYIAIQTMQADIRLAGSDLATSYSRRNIDPWSIHEIAMRSYRMADAMLRARDQTSNKEYSQLMTKRLSDLDLSIRSLNCLKAENIETIEQLISNSANDLLKMPNLGRRSLNELVDVLAQHGLTLREAT